MEHMNDLMRALPYDVVESISDMVNNTGYTIKACNKCSFPLIRQHATSIFMKNQPNEWWFDGRRCLVGNNRHTYCVHDASTLEGANVLLLRGDFGRITPSSTPDVLALDVDEDNRIYFKNSHLYMTLEDWMYTNAAGTSICSKCWLNRKWIKRVLYHWRLAACKNVL